MSLINWLVAMFKALFSQNHSKRHAHALYGAVVARSRDAQFFHTYGVPDTLDGRFEVLVIHLFMLHSRLKDEETATRKISQLVFDNFIDDMDSALREAGVGDQSVPKRIAKMTQVFYGRTGAFETALESSTPIKILAEVIDRNLFPEGCAGGEPELLADYMVSQVQDLSQKTVEQIIHKHEIYGVTS
ncbi:MAG: ubiquinol-cytochrome C chaperone family protein [Rhizobiaceae bacterium]